MPKIKTLQKDMAILIRDKQKENMEELKEDATIIVIKKI